MLTMREKRALGEENREKVKVGELCDDLKLYIANHPTQYKDQVNPPRRLDRVKRNLGDRAAVNLRPKDIEAWLDGLINDHAQRGACKSQPNTSRHDCGIQRWFVMTQGPDFGGRRPCSKNVCLKSPSLGLNRKEPSGHRHRLVFSNETTALYNHQLRFSG